MNPLQILLNWWTTGKPLYCVAYLKNHCDKRIMKIFSQYQETMRLSVWKSLYVYSCKEEANLPNDMNYYKRCVDDRQSQ